MRRFLARSAGLSAAALGHVYTIWPYLERRRAPLPSATIEEFRTTVADSVVGPVEISGLYLSGAGDRLTVIMHGLGGNTESGYMRAALSACAQMGLSALLLNQRGADRRGHDFAHAGLIEDLAHVLRNPRFASFSEIALLGFSLGGHTALRYACVSPDPRLRRVAAICSPLDLAAASAAFDRSRFSVYRRHVLESLHQTYTAAYQRNPSGIEPYEARKIWRIREWDERVIAPRFGFPSALDYYQAMSVAPLLPELKVESLYLGAVHDPMVPRASVVSALASAQKVSEIWVSRAGHLGFAPDFDLGFPDAPAGLFGQVLGWLWGDRHQNGFGAELHYPPTDAQTASQSSSGSELDPAE